MITIIRWFKGLFNKEFQFLSRYKKSHLRFILYLSLDALLSLALVVGGFHFFGHETWASHEKFIIQHQGLIPEPVDRFITFITGVDETAFWLGPIAADKYTFVQFAHDVDAVFYWPKGLSPSNVNPRQLMVKTFRTLSVYSTNVHALFGAGDTKLVTAKGNTVEFNKDSMDVEMVTLSGRPEFIIIRYPAMQTMETLQSNADKLKLVR